MSSHTLYFSPSRDSAHLISCASVLGKGILSVLAVTIFKSLRTNSLRFCHKRSHENRGYHMRPRHFDKRTQLRGLLKGIRTLKRKRGGPKWLLPGMIKYVKKLRAE